MLGLAGQSLRQGLVAKANTSAGIWIPRAGMAMTKSDQKKRPTKHTEFRKDPWQIGLFKRKSVEEVLTYMRETRDGTQLLGASGRDITPHKAGFSLMTLAAYAFDEATPHGNWAHFHNYLQTEPIIRDYWRLSQMDARKKGYIWDNGRIAYAMEQFNIASEDFTLATVEKLGYQRKEKARLDPFRSGMIVRGMSAALPSDPVKRAAAKRAIAGIMDVNTELLPFIKKVSELSFLTLAAEFGGVNCMNDHKFMEQLSRILWSRVQSMDNRLGGRNILRLHRLGSAEEHIYPALVRELKNKVRLPTEYADFDLTFYSAMTISHVTRPDHREVLNRLWNAAGENTSKLTIDDIEKYLRQLPDDLSMISGFQAASVVNGLLHRIKALGTAVVDKSLSDLACVNFYESLANHGYALDAEAREAVDKILVPRIKKLSLDDPALGDRWFAQVVGGLGAVDSGHFVERVVDHQLNRTLDHKPNGETSTLGLITLAHNVARDCHRADLSKTILEHLGKRLDAELGADSVEVHGVPGSPGMLDQGETPPRGMRALLYPTERMCMRLVNTETMIREQVDPTFELDLDEKVRARGLFARHEELQTGEVAQDGWLLDRLKVLLKRREHFVAMTARDPLMQEGVAQLYVSDKGHGTGFASPHEETPPTAILLVTPRDVRHVKGALPGPVDSTKEFKAIEKDLSLDTTAQDLSVRMSWIDNYKRLRKDGFKNISVLPYWEYRNLKIDYTAAKEQDKYREVDAYLNQSLPSLMKRVEVAEPTVGGVTA
eukprot:Clim_evm73s108 gene=Clim_evmTU73s108